MKKSCLVINGWKDELVLRRFNDSDLPFLQLLYGSIREPELRMTNFTEDEKEQFIFNQFMIQHSQYCKNYETEHFYVIEVNGKKAGRFYIDYWDNEIRVVDIALLPEFRQSGIGSHLLEYLFQEALTRKLPVTIHVEHQNPARHLYERLGFKLKSKSSDVYMLMEWAPSFAG